MKTRHASSGFTLIEMVMVIVIMGAIGGMVSVFMKSPIDAYFASARRAALTDVADTAVRRMARDVRRALPNSLRMPTSGSPSSCIEFIPTKTGGRYRADVDATLPLPQTVSVLDFTAVDASFNMLGDNSVLPSDQSIAMNDRIAIYNLGIAGADAYNFDNIDTVNAVPTIVPAHAGFSIETRITTAGRTTPYPLASPNSRFHVIPSTEHVVSYFCTGVGISVGEGTGMLYRNGRVLAAPYATPATCPATPAGTLLAKNVSACSFVYNGSDLLRNGLLQVAIEITQGGETESLYHEVHVDNTP